MKGILGTADLMRAVFNKEHGLRTGRLTTHCMFYEIPALGRMVILTDGGVNTFFAELPVLSGHEKRQETAKKGI